MNSMDFCMCFSAPDTACQKLPHPSIIHPVTTQLMNDVNNPQSHTIFDQIFDQILFAR